MAATADARRSGESPLPDAAAPAEVSPLPPATSPALPPPSQPPRADGVAGARLASSGLLSMVRLASNTAVIRWSSSPSSSLRRWRYHFSPLRSSSST